MKSIPTARVGSNLPGRSACCLRATLPLLRTGGRALLFLPWLLLLTATIAFAQTAPRIESLYPAGAQQGTKLNVELVGEFMPGTCGLSAAGAGLTIAEREVTDRFSLTIAADAPLGKREFRLFLPQGASSPFPFIVGDLPEVVRPDDAETPTPITLPVTLNGRFLKSRELHDYSLPLQAGQQIVCAVAAREFGSPVSGMLRLYAPDGKLVAESFEHRSADALLAYRAEQAGSYRLQIFDFLLAGGPQYIYRLTVTDRPWLDYSFPIGLAAGGKNQLTLYGWNLPGDNGRQCEHRVTPSAGDTCQVALPGGANQLSLPVGDLPELIEAEPNDTPEQAGELALPCLMNGRFAAAGDEDVYSFMATKGEKLSIDVAAADLGYDADVVLSISDATGKLLTELDDTRTSRDPSVNYTAPADGQYFIRLRDRLVTGSPRHSYRLRIGPPAPRLAAYVDLPALAVHAGETTNLAVKVDRLNGFAGELEVAAVGLPAGVTSTPQPVPEKPSNTVQLPLAVAEKLSPTGALVKILVRGKRAGDADSQPVEQTALVRENAKATSGSDQLWVAVSPQIPFTLSTTNRILEAPRLAAFPFPVEVERKEGFEGAIRLVGVERDARGSVVPLTSEIPAGETAGALPVIVQHGTTEGTTQRCRVMGVAEVIAADGKPYSVFHVAGGRMSMGCAPNYLTLSVSDPVIAWQPGDAHTVRVELTRHVPLGEVTVRLETDAPQAAIVCPSVTIPAGESTGLLTLQFPAAASEGLSPRFDITLRAETTRAGLPVYGQSSIRLDRR